MLHYNFQVSQRLTSDPKTTPQQCNKEIDNTANRAGYNNANEILPLSGEGEKTYKFADTVQHKT